MSFITFTEEHAQLLYSTVDKEIRHQKNAFGGALAELHTVFDALHAALHPAEVEAQEPAKEANVGGEDKETPVV